MSRSRDPKRIAAAPARQEAQLERDADRAGERAARDTAAPPHERPSAESAPLPPATRSFYESRLGHDFSRVRVHTGERAAREAAGEGASAFTVGEDVVFGAGAYGPETEPGRALLGHELAHVAQQAGGEPVLQKQGVTVVQGSPGLGLFRPPLLYPDLRRPMLPSELHALDAPIRGWLQAHVDEMRILSVQGIIRRLRQNVPEAATRSDGSLQATIVDWAAENNFTPARIGALPDAPGGIPPPPPPPPTTPLAELGRRVAGVVRAATDGVGYRDATGRAVISVSGATVGLRSREGTQVSGTVGWTGTLGLEAERGGVHFEASLNADKWELKLSFGADTAVPDLSRLQRIFTEGEGALRHIVSEASTFRNLSDIPRIRDAVHPYIEPVSDAIEAAQGIASAPRVNVGISASGPGYGPDQPGGQPRGIEVTATLTIRF